MAVTIRNIDPLVSALEANKVPFTMSKSGRRSPPPLSLACGSSVQEA